jgi:hypothetical protein
MACTMKASMRSEAARCSASARSKLWRTGVAAGGHWSPSHVEPVTNALATSSACRKAHST